MRGIKFKDCDCFPKIIPKNFNYEKKFDENLKKRFSNAYKFSNHDINKFILLLPDHAYPYECMYLWGKFDKTLLPEKEDFYSNQNMEGITDEDYPHAKKCL